MSPTEMFFCSLYHLPRGWRLGTKCLIHSRHQSLTTCCTNWYRFLGFEVTFMYWGSRQRLPGRNKSLHVIGCCKLSSVEGHKGLELTQEVIWANTVLYSSSLRTCCRTILFNTSLTLFAIASTTPLWWLALGVLNVHLIPLSLQKSRSSSLSSWFLYHRCNILLISLAAPTKFLPLSLRMCDGWPYKLMNRRSPNRNLSVDKSVISSTWTALDEEQLNIVPYTFNCAR